MEIVIGLLALVGLVFYFLGKKENKEKWVKEELPREVRPQPIYFDPLSGEPLIQNQTVELELPTKNGDVVVEVNKSTMEIYQKTGMTTFTRQKKSNNSSYPNKVYKIKRSGWSGSRDNDFICYDDYDFYNAFGYSPYDFVIDMIIDSVVYPDEIYAGDGDNFVAEEDMNYQQVEEPCTEEQYREDLCTEEPLPVIVEEVENTNPQYVEEREVSNGDSVQEVQESYTEESNNTTSDNTAY
jgi:hypothetical protein